MQEASAATVATTEQGACKLALPKVVTQHKPEMIGRRLQKGQWQWRGGAAAQATGSR